MPRSWHPPGPRVVFNKTQLLKATTHQSQGTVSSIMPPMLKAQASIFLEPFPSLSQDYGVQEHGTAVQHFPELSSSKTASPESFRERREQFLTAPKGGEPSHPSKRGFIDDKSSMSKDHTIPSKARSGKQTSLLLSPSESGLLNFTLLPRLADRKGTPE